MTYKLNGVVKTETIESSVFRLLSNRVDRSQAKMEKRAENIRAEQEKAQLQQKIAFLMTHQNRVEGTAEEGENE